jgi:undecaprenyl-diphosphatase
MLLLLLLAQSTLPPALQNDYIQSLILGIVEGLTEFLPVSSTAHLRIAEMLLKMPLETGYWKMYTVVIQLGAILALPVYFMPRILKLLSTFPTGERGDRTVLTHPLSLVMIAFVITAGPAFLLEKQIGKNLDNFYVIGLALLIGGFLMWVIDATYGWSRSKQRGFDIVTATIADQGKLSTPDSMSVATNSHYQTNNMEEMTLAQACWIGACQILSAVFPGTSRSMSTIAAGQVTGMSRPAALEFSFFLSIPTMTVATLWELKKAVFPTAGDADAFSPGTMGPHEWTILAIGFIVSFIVALAVVAWFMAWVRHRGFALFAAYRIMLGLAVLYWIASASH